MIIKLYQLTVYYDHGDLYRVYAKPEHLDRLSRDFPPLMWAELFFYKYLLLHPRQFKDYELVVHESKSDIRLDVERVHGGMYCVSERFKQFVEQERIPLDFFPIRVEGEGRYLMMWRRLPVVSDYEVDREKSKYYQDGALRTSSTVIRSDILEYLEYHIFDNPSHIFTYVTDSLKAKFDCERFLLGYRELGITHRVIDPTKVRATLLFARRKERELYLTEQRKQRLQKVDDYLEKILVEEGDLKALDQFRSELKGIWKRDFERYEQGLMTPDERITYW